MTYRRAVRLTVLIATLIVLVAFTRIAMAGHEEGAYAPVCEAVYEAQHIDTAAANAGLQWQASVMETPDTILQDDLLTEFQWAVADAVTYYAAAVDAPVDDIHAMYLYYRLIEFSLVDDGLVGIREFYDTSPLFQAADYYKMRADELSDTLQCVNQDEQMTE
jgi:hypothetical protein